MSIVNKSMFIRGHPSCLGRLHRQDAKRHHLPPPRIYQYLHTLEIGFN